ncbi:MAG: hypothetical protein JEY94_13315 [Melioribacteraceae bacterium]|nr:hypothetical protein [Melioribacteraceae bacterium]
MKKISILVLLLSTISFAQGFNTNTLMELKQNLKVDESLMQSQSNPVFQKKKTGLAIIYSLLLPGMGELYAGGFESGKYFTIADGVLWGVLAGMNIHASNKEDDYKSYAEANGGVNLDGKTEDFFASVGIYISQEDYNHAKSLNRQFDKMYDGTEDYWKWENSSARKEYRELWKSSEESYNNIRFVAGALVLNRLVSAINAVRLVTKHNKRQDVTWNVSMGMRNYESMPSTLNLNFYKKF